MVRSAKYGKQINIMSKTLATEGNLLDSNHFEKPKEEIKIRNKPRDAKTSLQPMLVSFITGTIYSLAIASPLRQLIPL
jgi:hypothetical protein